MNANLNSCEKEIITDSLLILNPLHDSPSNSFMDDIFPRILTQLDYRDYPRLLLISKQWYVLTMQHPVMYITRLCLNIIHPDMQGENHSLFAYQKNFQDV